MTEASLRHVYLVDGSGFIFRAFHALPPMTNPQGVPVNAVFGFTNMLIKLLTETDADHVAVVFDAGRTTFRTELYPPYKAHRPDPPEELVPQFGLIRDAVRAFNVACVELAGFEADDLIATYARAGRGQGRQGHHRLVGQGSDAAGRRRHRDVRSDQESADRSGRGVREIRRRARQGDRRAGAGRRSHRQRAGRAGHRRSRPPRS